MSFSGIVVRAATTDLESLAQRLGAVPGVQVHQRDPDSNRLILTLDAETVDDEIDGLRRIQCMSGVASADLVYHLLGDKEELADRDAADSIRTRGEP